MVNTGKVQMAVRGLDTRKQLKEKIAVSREELVQQIKAIHFRLAGLIDKSLKQKVTVKGYLGKPLQIGCRAYLVHEDKISATSIVTSILAENENIITFETAGGIYTVPKSADSCPPV